MAKQPSGFAENLRTLKAAADAIAAVPIVAGKAYAGTGAGQSRGIVDGHFTAGNSERYGWPPLSPEYFRRKQGQAAENRLQMKRHELPTSKMDSAATFRTKNPNQILFGAQPGVGAGKNLPMLVARGFLRNAVNTTGHVERTGPDSARITWQVPDYGAYHHEGAGRNPKRSPIDPNAADLEKIRAAVEKFIAQSIGRGRVEFTP